MWNGRRKGWRHERLIRTRHPRGTRFIGDARKRGRGSQKVEKKRNGVAKQKEDTMGAKGAVATVRNPRSDKKVSKGRQRSRPRKAIKITLFTIFAHNVLHL